MKRKISIQNLAIILTGGLILFRLFSSSAESGTAPVTSDSYYDDGFVNYVCLRPWEDQGDLSYWNINRHFDSFTELNYTAAHSWSGPSAYLGRFEDTVLSNAQLDTIATITGGSQSKNLKLFLERIRLSYLCYAQRLVYEVGSMNSASNKDINYGFAYQNNMKPSETDTGYGEPRTVQHAIDSIDQPGYLCRSIYENLQHTDLYYFSRGWYDLTNWYLKPVMRIKQTDYSSNDTTRVVSIYVLNYLGEEIDTITIQVRNFSDLTGPNYSGNYLTDYTLPYAVSGSLTDSTGLNFGRPGKGAGVDSCKVDFRIYWHGLVEVWFDKLIVDDEWADNLYKGVYDRRIRDEAEKLGSSMVFFVDELVSSNAHATKYVKDKLKSYNPDSKLMFALSNNLNHHSHRNDESRSKVLFDIVKPDIVCLDDHVFQVDPDYKIYLPDNAEQYDARIPVGWKESAGTYNNRLQANAFGSRNKLAVPYQGTFIYQLTKIRDDLRQISPSTKFFIQPHLHSWTKVVNNIFQEGFGFREPTNQEIQAQGMIAIAHGVESLSWINYHSDTATNINSPGNPVEYFFSYGLRNFDHTKRESNIIGQNKWEYVKAMNLKLLHWKPTLDSITWQSGYSVHSEGTAHEYISDIRSIKRDPAPPHDFILDDATKYWEMGFFTPDKPNDRSKYFIMVNRRCVPDINQTGDVRQLKIKFDSAQLAGFNNWTITELDSNHTVATFDRRSVSFIDFGLFQPGEGKLYKLAPVMQEGGVLVADEDCGGFEFMLLRLRTGLGDCTVML